MNVAARPALNATVARTVADGTACGRAAKGVLTPHCGTQYNRLWNPTGFIGSLEVPTTAPEVKSLLQTLEDYFIEKPEHEVASLEVTAAQAKALRKAISKAEGALQDHDDDTDKKKAARDAALEGLRARLRGLVNELTQLIGRESRRWHSFGFNIPAEPDTPEKPQGVAVTPGGPQQLDVACAPVSFADHYRFWTQPEGSTDAAVEAGSSREPSLTLANLAGGARLKVFVSAVNKAGNEGPRSEPVEATVPGETAAAA